MLTLRAARWTGLVGMSGFVTCVVIAHVAQSSLDPASHMISEYARHDPRTVISVGFGLWAASLAASAVYIGRAWPANLASRALVVLVLLGAVGVVVLASFRTQTSAGEVVFGSRFSTYGRLHDAGSGLVAVALSAGACVTAASNMLPTRTRTAIVTGLLVAIGCQIALLSIGPEVAGVRQRFLLACALLWQAMLLNRRSRVTDATGAQR